MRKISLILCGILLLCLPVSGAGKEDVVYSWKRSDKKIALTFDDGPHPTQTPEILDILEEYGIRATFFVIGQNADWYGDCLAMEMAAGHEIGNHSWSHGDLTRCYDNICREIDEAERMIWEKTEYRTHLLRPPGGQMGEDFYRAAGERDYTVVCWSVDTLDWAHTPSDVIAENVLANAEGGDIILFHDYISGESPTPAALRIIIPALLERGFEFVTVSELMAEQ